MRSFRLWGPDDLASALVVLRGQGGLTTIDAPIEGVEKRHSIRRHSIGLCLERFFEGRANGLRLCSIRDDKNGFL